MSRIKRREPTAEELAQGTEYSRRKNMSAHVNERIIPSERSVDTFLSLAGIEVGSAHTTYTRGKRGATSYVLPSLDKGTALGDQVAAFLAMPEAKR